MSGEHLSNIPMTHRETARVALRATVGSATIDSIRPIPGGVSGALVYRVDAGGRCYVLRMEGLASPLRNPHQYTSMRIAAEAGIAPRLYHVDEVARVAVMDFIVEQPLNTYPGGPHALAQALGDMLRRLQGTPRFGRFVDYPDITARLWAHVCRTNLFAPGVLDAHTQRLADLRSAYTWNSDEAVSSHNDILPRNLLFDGERLWLVDWESAYCNDPVVDMATMLDNFAPSPELEEVLLQAWLGHPPDRSLRDRLELMRALTRLFYAGVQFSAVATASRSVPDTDLSAPTLAEFQQALRDGRLAPDALETRHLLGKMYLAAFFTGEKPPGLPPPISAFQVMGTAEA
jgi:aminoglycoside phosphotransferase (APT) family kinase protein